MRDDFIRKVAVLKGGLSSERAVSLVSGRTVASALRQAGFDVDELDVTDAELRCLDGTCCDVVFIALHGGAGEDGTVQRMLAQQGLPYTGSGPTASLNAMNKVISKRIFERSRIPTPTWFEARRGRTEETFIALEALGYSCVVKPASEGSSFGVTMVGSERELRHALAEAWRYGDTALIEERIEGLELTVGILGDRALPIVHIRAKRPFYNYEAKYDDNDTEYLLDIDIDSSMYSLVQETALAAHRTLDCEGFSRVDLMLAGGVPYVLEVNTIPGFTSHSLLPKAARKAGLRLPALCAEIVHLAVAAKATQVT